jgi:hypothetical protein
MQIVIIVPGSLATGCSCFLYANRKMLVLTGFACIPQTPADT